jgi:hypothetical protein
MLHEEKETRKYVGPLALQLPVLVEKQEAEEQTTLKPEDV